MKLKTLKKNNNRKKNLNPIGELKELNIINKSKKNFTNFLEITIDLFYNLSNLIKTSSKKMIPNKINKYLGMNFDKQQINKIVKSITDTEKKLIPIFNTKKKNVIKGGSLFQKINEGNTSEQIIKKQKGIMLLRTLASTFPFNIPFIGNGIINGPLAIWFFKNGYLNHGWNALADMFPITQFISQLNDRQWSEWYLDILNKKGVVISNDGSNNILSTINDKKEKNIIKTPNTDDNNSEPNKSDQTKSETNKSTESESTEPESTESESTEPESTEPESTEPKPTEPKPTEPEPNKKKPTELETNRTKPTEQEPNKTTELEHNKSTESENNNNQNESEKNTANKIIRLTKAQKKTIENNLSSSSTH